MSTFARLKQLPTGWRARNKEEHHRKLLICAPDCQSATGALHYRHEERSSASSNPSVLFNYTRAPCTNTHMWVCACAQLPGNNADLLVESGTQALTLRQGEEEMNISHREKEDTGSWSSRVTADTQPTVALPACYRSAVFQPLLHTHLYQQLPSWFFVIECLHSPAR